MRQTRRTTLITVGGLFAGASLGATTVSAAEPTVEVTVGCTDAGEPMFALENDVEDTSTVYIDGPTTTDVTLSAGEAKDVPVDSGTYTITATSLGKPMRVNDQDSVTVETACADPGNEVNEGQTVGIEAGPCEIGVENSYGEEVTIFIEAHQKSDTQESATVPAGGGADIPADAGTYTVTAKSSTGDPVPVNSQDELTVTVECSGTGEPPTVLANGGCKEISLANETGTTVDITVDGPNGTETRRLRHLGDIGYPTEVGEYTITAQTTDGDPVPVNNEEGPVTVLVVECHVEAVNVDARSYDCDILEVENENKEVSVTVDVFHNGMEFDTIQLGPDDLKRVGGYEPNETYTLEAYADGRSVTVNGANSDKITMMQC